MNRPPLLTEAMILFDEAFIAVVLIADSKIDNVKTFLLNFNLSLLPGVIGTT